MLPSQAKGMKVGGGGRAHDVCKSDETMRIVTGSHSILASAKSFRTCGREGARGRIERTYADRARADRIEHIVSRHFSMGQHLLLDELAHWNLGELLSIVVE
eukprot:scaffold137175_cov30-Tisochrysis_lutea.AAC.2